MQTKKKEVKEKIEQAAYKEFKEKGFQNASIRGIAQVAGLTKGSIYTYYKNKDDLYCSIVQPALDIILDTMNDEYGQEFVDGDFDQLYQYNQSVVTFREQVAQVTANNELMSILFFNSAGSSLEDYKERIIQRYEISARNFYKIIGKLNPDYKANVTQLFMHSCAILYIGFIEEILIHEPDEETIEQFVREMTSFVHYGTEYVIKRDQ